jgi:outer membrane protein insertion porin family
MVVEEAPASNISSMRGYLEIAPGQDFSPVRIHDSIVRLYKSGMISNARVEAQPEGTNNVRVTFIVRLQPRIESVIFEGSGELREQALRARLNDLDVGERLTNGAIQRGLNDIKAYYASRGFYQAEVVPEIRLDTTGTRATVAYKINTGPQAVTAGFNLSITGARVDLSQVRHFIVEGKAFTQADIQREMDVVRDAYLKANYLAVRLTPTTTPDPANNKVSVSIEVVSGPLFEVVVSGIEISDKEKREVLPFYTQGNIDEFSLEDGRRRLLDYAQREGYFFAEINTPSMPDLAQSNARLEYAVETGARYRLTDIDIEGMDAIPSAELQQQLMSKKASFIPLFGLNRGRTSNETLRLDSNTIEKRLRDLGYRRAQVEVLRGISPSGERLIITFRVKQGARTHIEEIGIRGNTIITEDQLRIRVDIKPDTPLITTSVTDGADRIIYDYNSRGYANAQAVAEIYELGSQDGVDRVRLVYAITEGNRVRIANITTRGEARTDEGRLERDFYLFKPGDWLLNNKLQETERVLYDTEAFSSVTITSRPVNVSNNGIEEHEVSVDLAEAKPWLLIYGFGYQDNKDRKEIPGLGFLNGARGLIQLTNTNLFGQLYTGSMQFRVSPNELFGQISFQNPRPFGYTYPVLISIIGRRLGERTFRSDRYTALLQVERRLSSLSLVYMSYNFERIKIFLDPDASIEEIARNSRDILIGRIGPSYARDTRDRAVEPTSGSLTTGSFFLASKAFGGNEQFVKFLAEHNRYYPIKRFRETVYTVSGRLGLASPFGGNDTLPISERFFAGGPRDLRGLDFEEAGPRDSVGLPTGGNAMFVLNNELRFPIYSILGGAVFSDTGNVFERVRDFRPQDFTQTLGVGLRLKTPVGPLRVDLGYLVFNKPVGEKQYQIHFSFGSTF